LKNAYSISSPQRLRIDAKKRVGRRLSANPMIRQKDKPISRRLGKKSWQNKKG